MLNIHLVSDLLSPLSGMLQLRLLDLAGAELGNLSSPAAIAANTAGVVLSLHAVELLQDHDPASVVLLAELKLSGEIVSSIEHYFVPAKEMKLGMPEITMTEEAGSYGATFTLTTDTLAKQVWLSAEAEGQFTDNFFDLVPGIAKKVTFLSRQEGATLSSPSAPGNVHVKSMSDFIAK